MHPSQISKTVLFLLCSLLVVTHGFCAHRFFDQSSPEIIEVNPINGNLWVPANQPVNAILDDPVLPDGSPGSGVDIDSIILSINKSKVVPKITILKDGMIFVSTVSGFVLPEDSWINAEIEASDLAGNRMDSFSWSFRTLFLPDTAVPDFENLSPSYGCMQVPVSAQISCKIVDVQSGVDVKSIQMKINGSSVSFETEDYTHEVYLFYQGSNPFPYNTWIEVVVSARDYAGNESHKSWWFLTCDEPVEAPKLVSPIPDDMLNYDLDKGSIYFNWSYDSEHPYYRLIISLPSYSTVEKIDLGPDDYEFVNSSIVEFKYSISEVLWKQISELGQVYWSVTKVSHYAGNPVSPRSDIWNFQLAPPHTVVLRTPLNHSQFFHLNSSPTFSWDPFENTVYYDIGFAQIGINGEIIGEVMTFEVSPVVTNFFFTQAEWGDLVDGEYIWSVVAHLDNGHQANCMNFYFEKYKFPPLQFFLYQNNFLVIPDPLN